MLYPCPACGFEVFESPAGSYDICPVCDWEDDEVQLRFPAMRGGANKECLVEWQMRAVRQLPLEVTAHNGFRRCSDWRPLNQEEYGDKSGTPTSGREYFDAVGAEEPLYYWREPREQGAGHEVAAVVEVRM